MAGISAANPGEVNRFKASLARLKDTKRSISCGKGHLPAPREGDRAAAPAFQPQPVAFPRFPTQQQRFGEMMRLCRALSTLGLTEGTLNKHKEFRQCPSISLHLYDVTNTTSPLVRRQMIPNILTIVARNFPYSSRTNGMKDRGRYSFVMTLHKNTSRKLGKRASSVGRGCEFPSLHRGTRLLHRPCSCPIIRRPILKSHP